MHRSVVAALVLCAVVACTSRAAQAPVSPVFETFETDDPFGGTGNGGTAGTTAGRPIPGSAGDAADLEEPDVVHLEGNRLDVLSKHGALTFFNVSVRDRLQPLGRLRLGGTSFDMIARATRSLVMVSNYPLPGASSDGRSAFTSELFAVDTSDPAAPRTVGQMDLPGGLVDSRWVGDVLYVVSEETGACFGGEPTRGITITSIDVRSPLRTFDCLHIPTTPGSDGPPSVTMAPNRIYVGGIAHDWNGVDEPTSVIEVIDIAAASGKLAKGATVAVEGQITNRWQMDEYEGVLRVVSQHDRRWWGTTFLAPKVQTFAVSSSNDVRPLGAAELTLTKAETLRSVRFDGARAYAVTAEQSDPLFTIDVADPARPQVKGQLEMPGWIHHLEPRGERLVTFGFDRTAPEGALHVSLFDVADLAAPKLLQRVNFARGQAGTTEDQNRFHKSFQALEGEGLVLVPFATSWRDECDAGTRGIQLIDWSNDGLKVRGVVPQRTLARRGLVHDGRLFAMSDGEMAVFDTTDRDAPKRTAYAALDRPVYGTTNVGLVAVSLSEDSATATPQLVSAPMGAELPEGVVDLDPPASTCTPGGAPLDETTQLVALDDHRVARIASGRPDTFGWGGAPAAVTVATVVDISDVTAPRLVGSARLPALPSSGSYWAAELLSTRLRAATASFARVGARTIHVQGWYDAEWPSDPGGALPTLSRRVSIVDLEGASGPTLVASFGLPPATGATGIVVDGAIVRTTRWERVPDSPGRVRFVLETIDTVSGTLVEERSVPGSLLDAKGDRALVVGYSYTTRVMPADECVQIRASTYTSDGTCTWAVASPQLVLLEAEHTRILDPAAKDDALGER